MALARPTNSTAYTRTDFISFALDYGHAVRRSVIGGNEDVCFSVIDGNGDVCVR